MKLYVEEKTAGTGGDTTEFTVGVDNKKSSTSVHTGTSTPLDCNEINYWNLIIGSSFAVANYVKTVSEE